MRAGPSEAVAAALVDASKLPASVRVTSRYLSLYNVPAAYQEEVLRVLVFQINSLSRESAVYRSTVVAPGLVRVNLLDYGIDPKVWEKLAETDPYFHVQVEFDQPFGYTQAGKWVQTKVVKSRKSAAAPWLDPVAIAALIVLVQSQAPVVRADWWFAQTARQLSLGNKQTGVGYYDFLRLQKRADLEKLVRLNVKDSLDIGREMRAALDRSGVAAQNRQIVRLQALTGGYWTTLDTDDSTGKGNAIRNLARGDMDHKAEEIYAVLPNGLFVTFLCNDQGVRQDSAPDFIGPDDSPLRVGRDARIHAQLACVRCHTEGLRPINDWARRTLRNPLGVQSPDYTKTLELRRQYFSNLDKQLERDRELYREALLECNGWTPLQNAKAFARFWDWYVERDRTLADVAVECGVQPPALLALALKRSATANGSADLVLSVFLLDPPGTVRVEMLEEAFSLLQGYLGFPVK